MYTHAQLSSDAEKYTPFSKFNVLFSPCMSFMNFAFGNMTRSTLDSTTCPQTSLTLIYSDGSPITHKEIADYVATQCCTNSSSVCAHSDICITPDKYNPDADLNGTTCNAAVTELIGSGKLLGGKLPTSRTECMAARTQVEEAIMLGGFGACCSGSETFCDQYAPNPCQGNHNIKTKILSFYVLSIHVRWCPVLSSDADKYTPNSSITLGDHRGVLCHEAVFSEFGTNALDSRTCALASPVESLDGTSSETNKFYADMIAESCCTGSPSACTFSPAVITASDVCENAEMYTGSAKPAFFKGLSCDVGIQLYWREQSSLASLSKAPTTKIECAAAGGAALYDLNNFAGCCADGLLTCNQFMPNPCAGIRRNRLFLRVLANCDVILLLVCRLFKFLARLGL